jgi:hypothetical protein
MSRFVIIFEGRNGSSHLVSMLNSHPSVLCYPEVLVGLSASAQRQIVQCIAADQDPRPINAYAGDGRYHLGGFAAKWAGRPFPSVGFKTKVSDMLGAPGLMLDLRDLGFRLIYLRRENILKSVTSQMNAQKLQKLHDGISNAERPDQVMGGIELDLATFDRLLERRRLAESLHTWFYDHYAGEKTTLTGAPPRDLRGAFHKNTPPSLREAVLN